MGYTNPDKRIVNVTRAEKKRVSRLRRRALKRLAADEHPRGANAATRRGWWYA